MAFLDLCKINSQEINKNIGFSAGVFLTENYNMACFRKKEALLIEGIHQYSSLIAESVFGKSPDSVFIPVMIKSMDIHKPANLDEIILSGEMISSGDFLHVRTTQRVSDQITGSADVFLKKIPLINHNAIVDNFSYGNDLFNVLHIKKSKNRLIVNFKLNGFHHIFKKHFRGYPVCPASLIIEFISDIILNYGLDTNFQIANAKFSNPLVPYNEYELDIQFSESTVLFIIIGPEQIRLTAGKLIYQ